CFERVQLAAFATLQATDAAGHGRRTARRLDGGCHERVRILPRVCAAPEGDYEFMTRCLQAQARASSSSDTRLERIGGIGTVSGRAPLTPGGLPGFKGPFPSTSLDKGVSS